MAKQKDFDSFLKNIEPSDSTVQYISSIQTNLRNYLKSDEAKRIRQSGLAEREKVTKRSAAR